MKGKVTCYKEEIPNQGDSEWRECKVLGVESFCIYLDVDDPIIETDEYKIFTDSLINMIKKAKELTNNIR